MLYLISYEESSSEFLGTEKEFLNYVEETGGCFSNLKKVPVLDEILIKKHAMTSKDETNPFNQQIYPNEYSIWKKYRSEFTNVNRQLENYLYTGRII